MTIDTARIQSIVDTARRRRAQVLLETEGVGVLLERGLTRAGDAGSRWSKAGRS